MIPHSSPASGALMELSAEQLLTSIWAALRRIEDNLALPPAPLELPAINVAPPDLAGIVTAVTGLKPGPTAEEIAAAIAGVMAPSVSQPDGSAALQEVAAALAKLDFRLKGMGTQAYGGGAVDLSAGSQAYLASEATLKDVKHGISDYEILLDYDTRSDNNPVYVGKNLQGTATSAATWTVQKMSYDVTSRLNQVEVLEGSWDGRAALPW